MAQAEDAKELPLEAVVGANIARLRQAKEPKWSQEKVARLAGLSVDTVRLIEASRDPNKATNSLRLGTLKAIADALEVAPAELLRWDEGTRVYLNGDPPFSLIEGGGEGGLVPRMFEVEPITGLGRKAVARNDSRVKRSRDRVPAAVGRKAQRSR
jgi:transcriptional regulator with XRE-family HTH domain